MKVIKRDGHTVTYDRSKIITAIKKANAEVEPGEKVTDEKIEEIVQGIESKNRPRMLVEDLQDIIEQKLVADGKLLTDDLLPTMAQALDDRYGKAAESAADTVQAAINRMSTAWTEFKAGLLDSGPAVFTIKFVTEVLEGKNAAEAARKRKEQLDSELERIGAQKSVVGQTIIGGIGAAPEVQPVMGYTDAQRQALARQKAMDDAANRQLQQGLQQQEQMLTKGREAITKALKETTASRRAALVEEKADALKAIDEMVAVYSKQGVDVEALLKDREEVSKAYDDKIVAFDKKAGKDAKQHPLWRPGHFPGAGGKGGRRGPGRLQRRAGAHPAGHRQPAAAAWAGQDRRPGPRQDPHRAAVPGHPEQDQ